MDRTGADFFNVIDMIKDRLGANPVPIVLPVGAGDNFSGIIDLISMEAIMYTADDGSSFEKVDIPSELKDDAEKWRSFSLEEVASYDEGLMEKYLEGEELEVAEIKVAIRKAALDGSNDTCIVWFCI